MTSLSFSLVKLGHVAAFFFTGEYFFQTLTLFLGETGL